MVWLGSLEAEFNGMEKLTLPKQGRMGYLLLEGNKLDSLDLSEQSLLKWLIVDSNDLTTLDVSNNYWLEELKARDNNLLMLDLSGNFKIKELGVAKNQQLSSLIVSEQANPYLETIAAGDNSLSYSFLDSLMAENGGWVDHVEYTHCWWFWGTAEGYECTNENMY